MFWKIGKEDQIVMQGLKTYRLSLLDIEVHKRGEGFSSLQFFNSAGVHEFAISCKVIMILMQSVSFDTE